MNHELERVLKQSGKSITGPRLSVFKALQKLDTPSKTGDIAKATAGVDRTSVYRTLELFATLGITTTVIRGWTPFTELAEPFKPHHHHLVCDTCDKHQSITNPELEAVLNTIATDASFQLTAHTVELSGICASCQPTA